MRKLLSVLLILMLNVIVQCKSFGVEFSIERRGEQHIQGGRVVQDIIVKCPSVNMSTIKVAPLDMEIINAQNPSIKIPISNISIIADTIPYPLNYGKSTVLKTGAGQEMFMKIIVNDIAYLRSGTYNTRLEFTDMTGSNTYTSMYVLNIDIPKTQELSFASGGTRIRVDGSKVFQRNLSVPNETNARVNVKSNVPWEVYLDTSNMNLKQNNQNGDYYFQVKNKSANISEIEEQKILMEPNRRYKLASGNVTSGNMPMGGPLPANFYVEYSYKNNSKGYIRAGESRQQLKYVIKEKI